MNMALPVAYDSKTFRVFCKSFNKSEVGHLVIGKVKSICKMGVWVDLGSEVSLCHISEACEHYITLAELQDSLAVGTRVTARVIKKHVDGKLSLSLKTSDAVAKPRSKLPAEMQ